MMSPTTGFCIFLFLSLPTSLLSQPQTGSNPSTPGSNPLGSIPASALTSAVVCSDGFSLSKDKRHCEKIDRIPMSKNTCPVGYIVFEKRCAYFVDLIGSCQSGFTMHEGNCTSTTTTPATATCPSGAILAGASCSVVKHTAARCPPGTEDGVRDPSDVGKSDKLICGVEVPSIERCPRPFAQQGKRCIRMYKPQAACPEGHTLSGDGLHCRSSDASSSSPRCPEGYRESAHSTCVREVAPTWAPCTSGTQTETQCSTITRYPATLTCPDNYSLDTQTRKCVRPMSMSCPKDYILSPSNPGYCVRVAPLSVRCQRDFAFVGGRCVKVVPTGKCTAEVTKKYVVEESFRPEAQCPKGYSLEGDSCVGAIMRPAGISCPEGYTLGVPTPTGPTAYGSSSAVSYVCTRTEPKACDVTQMQEECDPQVLHVCRQQQQQQQQRRLQQSTTNDTTTSESGRSSEGYRSSLRGDDVGCVPRSIACRQIEVVVSRPCPESPSTAPLYDRCPEGSQTLGQGSLCRVRVIVPPITKCAVGELSHDGTCTNHCAHEIFSDVYWECPNGFVEVPRLLSSQFADVFPRRSCMHEVAATRSNVVEEATPVPKCHTGVLENYVCVLTQNVPRVAVCPENYAKNASSNMCVSTVSQIPHRERPIPAEFRCDDGESVGPLGRCAEVTGRRDLVCPTGSLLQDASEGVVRCLRLVPSIPSQQWTVVVPATFACTTGTLRPFPTTTLPESTIAPPVCVLEKIAKPTYTCPPDYIPTVSQHPGIPTGCAMFQPLGKGCPAGFEPASGSMCIRRQQAPVIISLQLTCSELGEKCEYFMQQQTMPDVPTALA